MDRHGNINSQLCNLVSVSLSAESDRYHGVFTIQVIVIYFLTVLALLVNHTCLSGKIVCTTKIISFLLPAYHKCVVLSIYNSLPLLHYLKVVILL